MLAVSAAVAVSGCGTGDEGSEQASGPAAAAAYTVERTAPGPDTATQEVAGDGQAADDTEDAISESDDGAENPVCFLPLDVAADVLGRELFLSDIAGEEQGECVLSTVPGGTAEVMAATEAGEVVQVRTYRDPNTSFATLASVLPSGEQCQNVLDSGPEQIFFACEATSGMAEAWWWFATPDGGVGALRVVRFDVPRLEETLGQRDEEAEQWAAQLKDLVDPAVLPPVGTP